MSSFQKSPANIEDLAGSHQHRLMCERVEITSTYSTEITLYDYGGVYPIEVIWVPYVPSPAEFAKLSPRIEQALAPFHLKVLELNGLISGGAA